MSFFSKAALARRSAEVRPLVERLRKAGCRFVQMEMPENNGYLCGKLVPLEKGLAPSGTGIATLILTFKSGGNICFSSPFSNYRKWVPEVRRDAGLRHRRGAALEGRCRGRLVRLLHG